MSKVHRFCDLCGNVLRAPDYANADARRVPRAYVSICASCAAWESARAIAAIPAPKPKAPPLAIMHTG